MANTVNIIKPSGCFEIQKIIGISTIHGNCKSYQVQWAPSWLSGAHLIGCEDLIERFEQKQKEKPDIKIEMPDEEEQRVIDNNSTIVVIDTNHLQDGCELRNIEINNKEMMIGQDLHEDSTPMQKITEDAASKDTDFNSTPNYITHQVRLKVSSLDSVIQKISTKLNNEYVSRRTVHPDFQEMKMDTGSKVDIKADIQQQLSSNSAEIIPGEGINCETIKSLSLKDANNFGDRKRNATVSGSLFGRGKMKTKKICNDLSNVGESLTSCKSNQMMDNLEWKNEARKMFQCHICNNVFSNDVALEKHNKFHNSIYECIVCLRGFESEKRLKMHELKLHSACDICKVEFSNMEELKFHIETHKTVKTNPLECSYCGRINSSRQNAIIHERVHTGERPFKCNICQKAFKIKKNLKRHLNRIHEKKLT